GKRKAAAVGRPRRPGGPEALQERSELPGGRLAGVGHMPPVGLGRLSDPDAVRARLVGAAEQTDQAGAVGRPVEDQRLGGVWGDLVGPLRGQVELKGYPETDPCATRTYVDGVLVAPSFLGPPGPEAIREG